MITWVFLRPARLVESRQIANRRQKRLGGALTGLTSSTTMKTTKESFSFVIIIFVILLLSRQRMQQIPSATLPLASQGGAHSPEGPPKPPRLSTSNLRKLGDGGTASDDGGGGSQAGGGSRKPRRRESHSRRHTLQSGIDYGLLKRMKAIEEERDVLMRGIQTVQRAEEWYNEQLGQVQKNIKKLQKHKRMMCYLYNEQFVQVQERMRSLGQHGGSHQGPEPVGSAEAQRERLLFQNARLVK